mgnify:CR=1 FL=1
MWTTNDHQGHTPNDATEFAGLGCLGFAVVIGILAVYWCVTQIVRLLF